MYQVHTPLLVYLEQQVGQGVQRALLVVVVEEGRYWSTRDFTADASAMVRQLYRDGGATMQ